MKKKVEKKKLFGRNLFTLSLILGVLLILILGGIIIDSYYGTYKDNDVTAFESNSEEIPDGITLENVKRMNAKDFDKLNIKFSISEVVSKRDITFKLGIQKNENDTYEYSKATAAVCISADWVGYTDYSNKATFTIRNYGNTLTYSYNLKLYDIPSFPQKANTWPVKVEVEKTDLQFSLFISYSYKNEYLTNVTESYILEYSYSDVISGSQGAL
ncbi:MAG: hypothetical protein IJY14_04815 [Acholeplasmatales bacterium]|nr:hypothetical protein [Acholeplasmatales bacterium]